MIINKYWWWGCLADGSRMREFGGDIHPTSHIIICSIKPLFI